MLPLYDPTMILLLPALALALWAQFSVKSTYAKYARVPNARRMTGAQAAAAILRDSGVDVAREAGGFGAGRACSIECIAGELTDHYDPRDRVLRLSADVYHGSSIAAVGIAAHEVGHAVQHARMYSPLMLRNIIYPVCSLGSTLAFPLFFVGLLLPVGWGMLVFRAAIVLFALSVFFTVLTLPVEFNASRRAIRALADGRYLDDTELAGVRKVLRAAAMTYVAAAAMAILQLVRMLLIAQRRD